MSDPVRYIFYGGVDGTYQNADVSDPYYLVPFFGASAFGYAEGQLLDASISFSGAALDLIEANPGALVDIPIDTPGIDLSLAQPRAPGGVYTEDNLVGGVVRVQLPADPADPLAYLRAGVFDGADGPNNGINQGGIRFTDDDDAAAEATGLWLPDTVQPDVAVGTAGNDTLRGDADYNFLSGGDGNDILIIKDGLGWAWGGYGNDTLKGADGADFLSGGPGDDKIVGAGGNDVLKGGFGNDDVRGEEGDDFLQGGAGDDSVKGGSGNDQLLGQYGNDRLSGNDGTDTLSGGEGNDVLDGGSGADFLTGGYGDDTLMGGPGADQFFFIDGQGYDVISGFKKGEDKIVLDSADRPTFAFLIETAVEVGDDVVLQNGYEGTITFLDTAIADLSASDFVLLA